MYKVGDVVVYESLPAEGMPWIENDRERSAGKCL